MYDRYIDKYIDDFKCAPPTRKSLAGTKLWKKARKGRLGMATLR